MHTHITYYWDQTSNVHPFDQQGGSRLPAVTVFLAGENARRTLEAGVTTVRDLGANDWDDIAMRDLINRGSMIGPRMFVAGYGLYVADSPPRPGYTTPPGGRADNLGDVMRVIREEVSAGVDVIKMFGSTGTDKDVTGFQTYTFEEMKAAADLAHKYGKRLAVHSYGPDGANDAVRAAQIPWNTLRTWTTQTIAEMARRGTFYVPTIDHNRYYVDNYVAFGWTPRHRRWAERLHPPKFRYRSTRIQSGREIRDGFRCALHHVRPEHPRARLVRQTRHDTGTSPCDCHD